MDESSFFSLDKLVEFGCGMAIATQMAHSMNASLSHMRTPGADYPLQGSHTEDVHYAVLDGQATGPLSTTEFAKLIAEKRVTGSTYVWRPGMADWCRAADDLATLRLVAITPPPVPPE